MITPNKSILYSIFGAIFITAFWFSINQLANRTDQNDQSSTEQQTSSGPYKNGTYEASSPTPWGDMSISVVIKNGNWSNINSLKIPDSPPSQHASTLLAQQALQAQNSSINGVSGATMTTGAFRDDLNQIIQQSKT
jgi:uncharacterized protein with FMN-binding domain